MTEIVFKSEKNGFEWVSITDPSLRELAQIAVQYDLHSTSVHDCLEPEHLPKYEKINNVSFIIARANDAFADKEADTIRKLTNKIAIFASSRFLITVQRSDHEYLKVIRNKWRVSHKDKDGDTISSMILVDVYSALINSYELPVNNAMEAIERYEEEIFADTAPASIIQQMYLLRRQAMVYKRMLFLTNDIFGKISASHIENAPYLQDVIDKSSEIYYYAEQLLVSVNDLLNIHISLSSHRTNEVMRVLTISSVFFLPLTFIVGLYGMNFEVMPELKFEYSYYVVWFIMIAVVIGIYIQFRRQGWLKE
jgi:magnesium transporter